ncbi:MAG: FHA domain-containing protein [Planctomycetaceae bacterium]|nr:FHA domain-containing protein [Planctomycetaceae bacterium]
MYLFKDTAVMPSHTAIHIRGKSFVIEPLDRNGIVYVNCQPVSQRNLQNGDFINIGSTQFTFGTKDV